MAKNGRVAKPFLKDGLFYVRRRVPQDLLGIFGKTHYLKSIGTGVAAEAAHLFPAANAGVTSHFQHLRASTGSWPALAADRLSLIDSAIVRLIAEATVAQRKITNFAFTQVGMARVSNDDTPTALIARVAPAHRVRLIAGLFDDLIKFLPSGPLPIPVKAEVLKRLEARLPDFVTGWHLGFDFIPQAARKFTQPTIERDPNVTLSSLMNMWANATKPGKSALDDAKSVVRDFTDLFGNIAVTNFTRDDFDYFAGELPKLPAAMSRAERALPFGERVKLGGDPARPKAKDATPAKKLALLKAIMSRALKKKHIAYNPSQGLETGHKHQPDARRQMTSSEVRLLFSLPVFSDPTTWQYDREITDPTVAWVGLIGLVSGSRLGEIAQAHVNDVLEDEGHVALSITAADDERHPRSVKTPGSQRVIVIHPRVVSLGFLDYVAAIRASGSTLLFPDVAVEGGGLRSKEVSRRLNQLVDEVIARDEVVFHSLRHTFKARSRAAGVSRDIERQMTGHVPADVSGHYGLAFISQLAVEMNKMSFPMVPWDRIRRGWVGLKWAGIVDQMMKGNHW